MLILATVHLWLNLSDLNNAQRNKIIGRFIFYNEKPTHGLPVMIIPISERNDFL